MSESTFGYNAHQRNGEAYKEDLLSISIAMAEHLRKGFPQFSDPAANGISKRFIACVDQEKAKLFAELNPSARASSDPTHGAGLAPNETTK